MGKTVNEETIKFLLLYKPIEKKNHWTTLNTPDIQNSSIDIGTSILLPPQVCLKKVL